MPWLLQFFLEVIMRLKKRLLALILMAVLIVPGVLSPVLPVCAGGAAAGGLLGSGAADEINIIKILDMALNKGGMSMSPATIKAFLDFWWSSVRGDLSKCISNADSAITTTQVFADYVVSALEDADHYDKLGSIMVKYVQYVCALEGKSLSDIKQLLTQEGTFRRFLLSYVTDEDGNIAGTVDNKLKKYNLKGGLISMIRQAADAYIDEYEGYYLLPTFTYSDISPSAFSTKEKYDITMQYAKKIDESGLYLMEINGNYIVSLTGIEFVVRNAPSVIAFNVSGYNSNWKLTKSFPWWSLVSADDLSVFPDPITGDRNFKQYNYGIDFYRNFPTTTTSYTPLLFSADGRSIKIWKSLDALKANSVGKSNIYYSKDYGAFDESKDTGYTFTGTQYNGGYSHDIIQTTIDNSSEINESTINNIINNYITNNYGDGSGTGSGAGSGSGDDWWNIGDGITSFIKGVAALLDFLLKLLGDLIGVISDFLVGLLAVLEKLGAVGSSFGDFLKVFFGFLPEEIIDMIVVSIGFIVVVGVIKMFKG